MLLKKIIVKSSFYIMVLRGISSHSPDRREGYLFRRFNSILLLCRRFNWTGEKRYLPSIQFDSSFIRSTKHIKRAN
jgi:hypothetical protein